jgi:glycosyltransferase involved in cell wall biosynthesis
MSVHTPKVCHLTSAHPRDDVRIFFKQCCSLRDFGYEVSLVVADGKGDDIIREISIFDIGRPINRLDRIIGTSKRVLKKAVSIDASIYHLHDPELIPIGLKLRKLGKVVIFDAHEDLPKQILTKTYLNKFFRIILSNLAALYERLISKKFSFIVAATPHIRDKFLSLGSQCVDINNFPHLSEFQFVEPSDISKKKSVCYVGGISKVRGVLEIVKAISEANHSIRLQLAGEFYDPQLEIEVTSQPGWQKTEFHGWLSRTDVIDLFTKSFAGLVTLHPTESYKDALPVKMFEYMAAGLPVICSDFPLWREIIEGSACGICVDPKNPKSIAEAIDYLFSEPEVAENMSRNGTAAVLSKYNWSIEEKKLINLYRSLSEN